MIAGILLAGLMAISAPAVHEEARYVMGTLAVVRAEAADRVAAEAAVDDAFTAFAVVDSLMSTWRPDSPLSRLNRSEPGRWHPVDPRLGTVIETALAVAAGSGGAFDPTVLPLVEAWGLRGGAPRIPSDAELTGLLARGGFAAVTADSAAHRVRFTTPALGLDLGGIAKGYALDRAREAALAAGATAGWLDLGGNLLVFGPVPGPVGIVAPDDPSRVVHTVRTDGGAVATSGQYERFVEIDGRRFGHILDPRTGCPVDRTGSVTVLAPDALIADAVATALFVLGPDADPSWLAAWPVHRVIWVLPDGAARWQVRRTWPAP